MISSSINFVCKLTILSKIKITPGTMKNIQNFGSWNTKNKSSRWKIIKKWKNIQLCETYPSYPAKTMNKAENIQKIIKRMCCPKIAISFLSNVWMSKYKNNHNNYNKKYASNSGNSSKNPVCECRFCVRVKLYFLCKTTQMFNRLRGDMIEIYTMSYGMNDYRGTKNI